AVKMNVHLASPDLLVFFAGLMLTAVLHVRKVRGSILWGILGATALAVTFKLALPHLPLSLTATPEFSESVLVRRFELARGIVAAPPSLAPTFLRMDLVHAVTPHMLPFIFVFLFMLVFDAIGTLIGVCEQAGFMRDNQLPRAKQAMLSDAIGTVAGAALGTSTVTSFIESAAGVEQGGRTGLTGLVVAGLFLLALFFSPLIAMVGSYPPITAPALVIVGAMMIQNVQKIDWRDYSESVPAFLTMIGIPLSYSIADGLALGFISYPVIKLFSGKGRDIVWLTYPLAIVLMVYFIFVRGRM
ncbi:MAG: NCS2 family permease, partial [Verrucomicrobia bacterium]|nr:NCS2 family permease [Verrucomicrobiota bacterium]